MKKIMFLVALFVTALAFTSCDNNDDNKMPTIAFAKPAYALTASTPLTVEIVSSITLPENTVVRFTIEGTAEEDKDFTVSAHEFTIKAGENTAKIEITPKENYAEDLHIKLVLNPVGGFDLGANKETVITIEPKEKLRYSFVKDYDVLAGELIVGIELKKADGTDYIATEEIRLPFIVDETSTAVAGTHFSVENNVTDFVIPMGKRNATIKLKYIKQEAGKDNIILKINPGERFAPGNYDEISIKVYGPTTVGKLFGKWVYKEDNVQSQADAYKGLGDDNEFVNIPKNNSVLDTLEFIVGEKDRLVPHLNGDLKNYFREGELTYLKDTTMQEGSSIFNTYSLMEMSRANVSFSANTTKERAAQVGFRVLDDGKTLEVTVYDYAPTDFFQTLYQNVLDAPEYYWLMWDVRLQFTFSRVEE